MTCPVPMLVIILESGLPRPIPPQQLPKNVRNQVIEIGIAGCAPKCAEAVVVNEEVTRFETICEDKELVDDSNKKRQEG